MVENSQVAVRNLGKETTWCSSVLHVCSKSVLSCVPPYLCIYSLMEGVLPTILHAEERKLCKKRTSRSSSSEFLAVTYQRATDNLGLFIGFRLVQSSELLITATAFTELKHQRRTNLTSCLIKTLDGSFWTQQCIRFGCKLQPYLHMRLSDPAQLSLLQYCEPKKQGTLLIEPLHQS